MTAAAQNLTTPEMATIPMLSEFQFPAAASRKLWCGTIALIDAAGNLTDVPALGQTCIGAFIATYDNSAGIAGAIKAKAKIGIYKFKNSAAADAIAEANRGADCFVVDNQTVALTDGNATRPVAGTIVQVDSDGVWVSMGFGFLIPDTVTPATVTEKYYRARGVAIANVASLAAFAGVAGGAPNNGITYVQGDVILLANQTTAAQNGLYTVGVVAAGVAPLTRIASQPTGSTVLPGTVVEVGNEGTLLAGSTWKAMNTGAIVVDTTDPKFYPKEVFATVTLVAGTKTLGAAQGLFLFATTSNVQVSVNTPNTVTSSIGWSAPVASRVAGVSGTGAIVVNAFGTTGATNAADVSSVDVLATNW